MGIKTKNIAIILLSLLILSGCKTVQYVWERDILNQYEENEYRYIEFDKKFWANRQVRVFTRKHGYNYPYRSIIKGRETGKYYVVIDEGTFTNEKGKLTINKRFEDRIVREIK